MIKRNIGLCIELLPKLKDQFFLVPGRHLYSSYTTTLISSSSSNFFVGNDPAALSTALAFSEKTGSPILGTQLHGCIIKLGFTRNIFTQNNLVKMYSRCGLLLHGFKVFDEMPQRNLVSWTLLISGAIQCGEPALGLEVFVGMMRAGLMPNEFALGSVLKVCASVEDNDSGSSVHSFVLKLGMERHPHVGCSILSFYAKSGDIEAAEKVFRCLDNVDVGCWNGMIGAYTRCGYGFQAISIVLEMQREGILMDRYTLISVLQGCSLAGNLKFGMQVHGLIFMSEVESSSSVSNALIDMYVKNGEINSALKVFKRMKHRDVVTWNTVFGCFSQFEEPGEVAILFYDFMLTGIRPGYITFSALFKQCGELLDIDLGFQFYCLALHFGLSGEANVNSSLINMFSSCGAMELARLVFDATVFKNTIVWNELISGYNLNCHHIEALCSFCNLLKSGVEANEFTFSSGLEACCRSQNQPVSRQIHGAVIKSGFESYRYVYSALIKGYVELKLLRDSFELLNEHERMDMVSWGTMVSTLVRQGYNDEAIWVLNSLVEAGKKPDELILSSILNSCAGISVYYQTKSIHPFVIKLGFEGNMCVASAVLDAYAKCGDITSANMIFSQASKYDDVVVYNTMIMAYARHGLVAKAMEIFNEMNLAKLWPNQATFVSIISACGHMGLVDQGCSLFKSMEMEYGLKPSPDTFGCLVDMFSRSGYLEDAKKMIEMMPYSPWPAILRSFLSGCRTYGNRELGKWAAEKLFHLVPENAAVYALLFDIYAEEASWEDAVRVRRGMTEKSLRKDPGQSWVEAF